MDNSSEKITADENNQFKVSVGYSTVYNIYSGVNNGVTYYVNGVENPILILDYDVPYTFSFITNNYPFILSDDEKGGTPDKPRKTPGYEYGTWTFPPIGEEFKDLFYNCTRSPWMGNRIEVNYQSTPILDTYNLVGYQKLANIYQNLLEDSDESSEEEYNGGDETEVENEEIR